MKKALGAAGVLVLAAALFAIGAVGPFAAGGALGTVAHRRTGQAGAPLAPAAIRSKLDESIAELQARLASDRKDWRAAASLGLAYLQKARLTVNPVYYSKAGAALRSSLDVERRDNFEGALGRGILAGARHDFTGALSWGRAAAAINPFNADAKGVVTDALVELGRYGAARRELQDMVDLRPDLASFARVSYYRELNGDVRGAVAAMTQAFEAVGGAGPDASWASYQLGELYFNSSRLGRASFAYRRAAFLNADAFLPKVGLARVAAARGHRARAVRLLRGVVRSYPAPAYVMQLGDLYAVTGQHRRAREEYALVGAEQRLFASNGVVPDVEILNFYSDHHRRLRWTLATARRAYAVRPSVRVADALAWSLYANGRFGPAMHYAARALRLGTRDATYRFHAGMIAAAAGEPEVARRYLRSALLINPNFSVTHAATARRTLADLGATR